MRLVSTAKPLIKAIVLVTASSIIAQLKTAADEPAIFTEDTTFFKQRINLVISNLLVVITDGLINLVRQSCVELLLLN